MLCLCKDTALCQEAFCCRVSVGTDQHAIAADLPDSAQASAQNNFLSCIMAGHAGDCPIEGQAFVLEPDAAACCLLGKAHQLPSAACHQKAAATGL